MPVVHYIFLFSVPRNKARALPPVVCRKERNSRASSHKCTGKGWKPAGCMWFLRTTLPQQPLTAPWKPFLNISAHLVQCSTKHKAFPVKITFQDFLLMKFFGSSQMGNRSRVPRAVGNQPLGALLPGIIRT